MLTPFFWFQCYTSHIQYDNTPYQIKTAKYVTCNHRLLKFKKSMLVMHKVVFIAGERAVVG